jgi:hypothetical protein
VPKPIQCLVLPFLYLALACGAEESAVPQPTAATAAEPAQGHAAVASLVPALPAKTARPEAGEARMAIDSLVPEGTVAWIRVASFDGLCDLADEFMRATSGPESEMDFETALGLLPTKDLIAHLDRTRSLGLAFGFSDEATGEPRVTLMLPVTDRGAAIQALRTLPDAPQCFGIDDYVVATNLDEYRPGLGSAELTTGLPEGQIAGRLDAQALMQRFGPLFEMGLQQMLAVPGPGLEGLQETWAQALLEAARAAESLDFALQLEGGEVDCSLAFVALPDSQLDGLLPAGSGNLRDLARCLEEDDMVSMLVAIDSETFQKQLLPLYIKVLDAAVAEGQLQADQQAAILEWGSFWPLLGDSIVTSVNADAGFDATYYFQPPDAENFRTTLEALLRSLANHVPSLQVTGPEQGAAETTYRVEFEGAVAGDPQLGETLKGLFPSGTLTLRLAERRGISVITIGDDGRAMSEALERIARVENELPQSLQYVLERVGDSNPAFVARIDLASVVRDLAPLINPDDQDRPDLGAQPLHVTYYGGVDGRTWRLGFRTDLSQIGALFK